jgi:hypothetical protein
MNFTTISSNQTGKKKYYQKYSFRYLHFICLFLIDLLKLGILKRRKHPVLSSENLHAIVIIMDKR